MSLNISETFSFQHIFFDVLDQRYANPGLLFALASKICQSSVWLLLRVTLLTATILRWLLDFWKVCVSFFRYLFFV
jgi:hypothetical protein